MKTNGPPFLKMLIIMTKEDTIKDFLLWIWENKKKGEDRPEIHYNMEFYPYPINEKTVQSWIKEYITTLQKSEQMMKTEDKYTQNRYNNPHCNSFKFYKENKGIFRCKQCDTLQESGN